MDHLGDDTVSDDDELEIVLRPPREVGSRIIILGAICRRAGLELEPHASDDPEGDRFDLANWLREERLSPLMDDSETRLLETRVGRLASDIAHGATWDVEALFALCWAAGFVEPAPWWTTANLDTVLDPIPQPWDSTRAFLSAISLRPEDVIAAERERAELWHWRATLDDDLRSASGAQHQRLRRVIRDVAREAAVTGATERVVDGDFPVGVESFATISAEQIELIATVSEQRLIALNWLCGFGDSWATVPLEV